MPSFQLPRLLSRLTQGLRPRAIAEQPAPPPVSPEPYALPLEGPEAEAQIPLLHAEIDRLRRDCAEAYQVMGAVLLNQVYEPVRYTEEDAVRALDNLWAAASGTPRPHEDLLPWPQRR